MKSIDNKEMKSIDNKELKSIDNKEMKSIDNKEMKSIDNTERKLIVNICTKYKILAVNSAWRKESRLRCNPLCYLPDSIQ